ncbi:hypothetical protein G6F50_012962 [Rhizopus delemar]|uniref:Uncharacterized protein n=1 Tax=Rhizopus delemar TaxID=936053 RepID=A0A9P6YQ26_9FUNG|nr:hypothetical protein G6F50_012962 [Rhizopus delemar]
MPACRVDARLAIVRAPSIHHGFVPHAQLPSACHRPGHQPGDPGPDPRCVCRRQEAGRPRPGCQCPVQRLLRRHQRRLAEGQPRTADRCHHRTGTAGRSQPPAAARTARCRDEVAAGQRAEAAG